LVTGNPGFPAGCQFLVQIRSRRTRRQDQIAIDPLEIARNPIARLNRFDPVYRRSLALIDHSRDV